MWYWLLLMSFVDYLNINYISVLFCSWGFIVVVVCLFFLVIYLKDLFTYLYVQLGFLKLLDKTPCCVDASIY